MSPRPSLTAFQFLGVSGSDGEAGVGDYQQVLREGGEILYEPRQ